MAIQKFLAIINGIRQEVFGTVVSTGTNEGGKIVALDASGKLDPTVLPSGIGAESGSAAASESLSKNDFINVYNAGDAQTPVYKVRKADGSNVGKLAHGYVNANFAPNAAVIFFTDGVNSGLSNLLPGDVWLSATTPGQATNTPPTAAGNIVQKLGVAVSATAINVNFGEIVLLA